MKIVSDFRDYYDFMQQYDDDRDTVFMRRWVEKLDKSPTRLPDFSLRDAKAAGRFRYPYYSYDTRIATAVVIGFCGQFYPLVEVSDYVKSQVRRQPTQFIYDPEIFKDMVKNTAWDKRGVDLFFDYHGDLDWFDKYGPVFVMRGDNDGQTVRRNADLGEYGFAHVIPPHLAYQSIARWLMNQARPAKPIPEMSNEVKIHQAGFDLKTSFRGKQARRT